MLVQELSRHAIDVADHSHEISWLWIVAQDELSLLSQVIRHICSRPHLSKDLTRKTQGTGPLIWRRHVRSGCHGG